MNSNNLRDDRTHLQSDGVGSHCFRLGQLNTVVIVESASPGTQNDGHHECCYATTHVYRPRTSKIDYTRSPERFGGKSREEAVR
jgi:hypothetical protein